MPALLWQHVSAVLPNCPCPEAMISSLVMLTHCVIPPSEACETCQRREADTAGCSKVIVEQQQTSLSFLLSPLQQFLPPPWIYQNPSVDIKPMSKLVDKSNCDTHINIMTYCHGIPHIFTVLFFLWHEWLPYFARVSVAFLRRWMCVCLFHLSISYLQTPCTPLNICSSATLARCPPPEYLPPVWNLRVWPLNSEPSLSFLQRCRLHS